MTATQTPTTAPAATDADRPARPRPADKCCSCRTAAAMDMFPRCKKCHVRELKAAYRGDTYRDLRRALALARELAALADDVADELPATRFARFHGEDDVFHIVRSLRTLADVADMTGGLIGSGLYPDPVRDDD